MKYSCLNFILLLLSGLVLPETLKAENKITIIYDAFGARADLRKDWGFSALIEFNGKRILFDTGNNAKIFAHNIEKLRIDLSRLDAVIISHRHGDHTSGLSYVLERNPKVKIYAPKESAYFHTPIPKDFLKSAEYLPKELRYYEGTQPEKFVSGSPWPQANFNIVTKSTQIFPDIWVITTQSAKPGTIEMNEISLVIRTTRGAVVIVGCSHSGVEHIVADAKKIDERIHSLIGGFHLVLAEKREVLRVATILQKMGIERVAPGHCTSELGFAVLLELFKERFDRAGLGTAIPLP